MAIPANPEELKEAIESNYNKLKDDLLTIPAALTAVNELEGHAKNTQMSVNNLVAYLVGWGQLVLKWNDKKDKGQKVDFPETGYKWNELGRLAQKFYADYEKDDYKMLLDKLDKTVKKMLLLIDGKTNAQLYKMPWYDDWTLGRMIQLNTASPYKNARDRIRKWKKAKGIK